MRRIPLAAALSAAVAATLPLAAPVASAAAPAFSLAPTSQPAAADGAQPVSRAEYDQLRREQADTRKELDALRKAQATADQSPGIDDDIDKEIRQIKDTLSKVVPGTETLLIAGDAAVGFSAQRLSHSSFYGGFAPLFLWQPTDRLLFEAALDVGGETDGSTTVDLTIANATVLVNDYLAVGGGVFVTPFGVYHNHFDPPWINKFRDDPLAFSDGGVAPGSLTGVFAKGAVPVLGGLKLTYDVYAANGPTLNTTDGSLNFSDFGDFNNNKAVGGRVGFLPVPNLEMGYSVMYSLPSPSGFQGVNAVLQAFDINWRPRVQALRGTFDVRAEWAIDDISGATYRADNGDGTTTPVNFTNYRSGGYVQLCYRPTMVENKFVRNLEFVSRYDRLTTPINALGGEHESRWTFGVDYWLTPYAVIKAAYEIDNKRVGSDTNALLIQFGIGL